MARIDKLYEPSERADNRRHRKSYNETVPVASNDASVTPRRPRRERTTENSFSWGNTHDFVPDHAMSRVEHFQRGVMQRAVDPYASAHLHIAQSKAFRNMGADNPAMAGAARTNSDLMQRQAAAARKELQAQKGR